MQNLVKILIVTVMMLIPIVPSAAETEDDVLAGIAQNVAKAETEKDTRTGNMDFLERLMQSDAQTEAEAKARTDFYTAVFTYRAYAENHAIKVFKWQLLSGKIIFAAVIVIVALGIYFSWMQFHAAKDPETMKSTTLKLGKAGVEVTSPVLGVVILVLSLAFLYLYLVHVYKITFV